MRPYLLTGTVVAALALAGCGSGGSKQSSSKPSSAPATAPPTASASGTKVALRTTDVGPTLVDGSGRTLYLFEKDKGTTSACYGTCAATWPAFTTSSRPAAGPGVDAAKIGMAKRRDGAMQVTYGGHPLYFYAPDRQPGDTRGQGREQFGAEWYALGSSGSKIEGHEGGASSGSSSGGSSGGGYSY